MKRRANDEDAPRCPPHPRFVRGRCFLCRVKEEATEGGGALAVAVGHEMVKEEGDAAAAACSPPRPEKVLDLSYRRGATEEDAGGSAASGVTVANIDRALAVPGCAAAATSAAGASDLATLSRKRKLILVLDLDRTLLNSTRLDDLSVGERWNGFSPDTGDKVDMDLFRLELDSDDLGMLTKLRPFVRVFLKEASSMFEMHVYTRGNQAYARDPNGVYFGGRVVSIDESTPAGTKILDFFPCADPVAAVILDALDETDVAWPEQQDNLILTNRYRYFAYTCRKSRLDVPSLAEQGRHRDEMGEHGRSLAVALGVLGRVHQAFFDGPRADVREVIAEMRGQVLRGCTVAFSYLEQRLEESPDDTRLWALAERLGAVCRKDVDETVTHVVAEDPGTCLFLSMKIAASNPVVSFDIVEDLFGRQLKQACSPAAALPAIALPAGQLEPSCLQMNPMQQQVHPSAAAGGSTGFGLDMVLNNLYAPATASCPVSAAPSVSLVAGPSTIEPCLNVNGTAAWDIGAQNLFSGFDAQFQSVESDCLLDNLKMEM